MRWLWLFATLLLLSGCLLPPAGYDAQDAYEERLPSSVVIHKGEKCQLRCTRIGDRLDCKEYRC